jgi:hypothetical protein
MEQRLRQGMGRTFQEPDFDGLGALATDAGVLPEITTSRRGLRPGTVGVKPGDANQSAAVYGAAALSLVSACWRGGRPVIAISCLPAG